MSYNIENLPFTLTVPQVAEIMGINKTTAYGLARTEGFPCIKIGKRKVVPRDAFFRWLNSDGKEV